MKKDVIIVGAGPAGLSLAISLAKLDLDVVIIEKQSKENIAYPSYDGKEIALNHLSKNILEQLDCWNDLYKVWVGLIQEAKVLDGISPYALHFDYREVCKDTLGYITANCNIRKVLYDKAMSYTNITILYNEKIKGIMINENDTVVSLEKEIIKASLLVAADSRFSETRRNVGIATKMHDFAKVAILCKMNHELPHVNTAYECFCYGSSLAVLPLSGNTSSIVITVSTDQGAKIMDQDPVIFNEEVTTKFSGILGKMQLSGDRFSHPLIATYADSFVAKRFALIGDAAVGMHPVTAHGFNLGLESQNSLANQIKKALLVGDDIASDYVLSKYNIQHKLATKPLYLATNMLVNLYTDDRLISKLLRKSLLRIGNFVGPARKAIMKKLTEI